jgi:pimeloyl-ACP methyl ester carboxylesterase
MAKVTEVTAALAAPIAAAASCAIWDVEYVKEAGNWCLRVYIDKPEGISAYRLDILVKDILGLMDTLQLEKVMLVGHDWGGIVAWALAALTLTEWKSW